MLNKNIDFALVGHNFFSYLMGIGLCAKKKNVLILDDDRFNHGSLFTDSLTIIDLEILKKWGEKYDIPQLKKIEEYIKFSPISFFVGKTEVLLGDNPSRNYRELSRKFPQFFSPDDLSDSFDQGIFQVATSLAESFYTDQNLIKISKRLENLQHLDVIKKFEDFFALFFLKNKWDMQSQSELNSFVTLGRGFFHNRLSIDGSLSELMHLFFSFLSPHFEFDHDRLVADLLVQYQSLGGEFKKINLADLKFQKGILSSFQFDSFEGIINPSHLMFIGGEPTGLPVLLKEKGTAFNSLEVKMQLSSIVPLNLRGKKILFSSPLKTGTSWPFWEASFYEKNIIFNLVMIKRQGIKEEFIKNKVLVYLLADLAFLYPEINFTIESSELKFTLDVLIEDNNLNAHLLDSPKVSFRPVKVFSKISPFSFFRLKNVSYLGPYSGNTHGIFSSLIQLRRRMEKL